MTRIQSSQEYPPTRNSPASRSWRSISRRIMSVSSSDRPAIGKATGASSGPISISLMARRCHAAESDRRWIAHVPLTFGWVS